MKTNVSGGLSFAAVTVAVMCLGTSVMQAGGFIADIIPDPTQKAVFVGGIVALLLGSQVLTRITGICISAKVPGWVVAMCLVCIASLEVFSITTSMTAFDGRLLEAQQTQNTSSTQYKLSMQSINNYQRQIDQLSQDAANLPSNYVTKRQRIQDKITKLQERQRAAQGDLNNINVSTSGAAFDNLESQTGVSQEQVALIAACMLSALPICINLAMGSLSRTRRKKEPAQAKKPKRHLHAV